MKRSGKRLLAWVLCLAMALTLLPMAALARWDEETPAIPAETENERAVKAELPVAAPSDDDTSADLAAGTILTDGVTKDVWSQDQATITDDTDANASIMTLEQGKGMHLKAGLSNGNGRSNGAASDLPAVFLNTTANTALSAHASDSTRYVEITFVPTKGKDNNRFGVYLNYAHPGNAFLVGYDNSSDWFYEAYKDYDSVGWGSENTSGVAAPAADQEVTLRLEWNDTKLISAMMTPKGGTATTLFTDVAFPQGMVSSNTVGIKAAGWDGEASRTEVYVKEMHYTGQATVSTYAVSGKVTDENGAGLADVAVTTGSYSATTNSSGSYTLELPAGTYTLTATKNGYETVTLEGVTVTAADVPNKNMTMEVSHTVTIQKDGAMNGDWTKVAGAEGTQAPVDDRLVLTSGTAGGYYKLSHAMTMFTSAKMTQALASESGEKTLSFKVKPESVVDTGAPDYLSFGVILNSNSQTGGSASGYYIGYSSPRSSDGYCDSWLAQNYTNGTGNGWQNIGELSNPASGDTLEFEITWTADAVTLKVNGTTVNTSGAPMTGITETNTVGFVVSGDEYNGGDLQNKARRTKLTIWDIHYSGQETEQGHTVAGTVKDNHNKLLKDVAVSAGNGKYTATTDANGKYNMILPEAASAYTVKAELDGYTTVTQQVEVKSDSRYQDLEATDFTLPLLPTITGKLVDAKGNPVASASVSSDKRAAAGKAPAVSGEDGTFTIIGAEDGEHTLTITKEGYQTTIKVVEVVGVDVNIAEPIVLPDRVIPFHTLSTEDMEVRVAQSFPQVIDYKMTKMLDNGEPLVMYGQTAELDTIIINGTEVKFAEGTITSVLSDDHRTVTYTIPLTAPVTATITAELRVGLQDVNDKDSLSAGRTLGFYITNVAYAGDTDDAREANRLAHPVDTIEIPNHSLVSVRSTQPGAAVTGGTLASNTVTSGDSTYKAADYMGNDSKREDYFAAFVYNDKLSAGLASNSAYAARGSAGDQCYPVRALFEAKDGGATESIGLGSTLWYYDHDITRDEANGDQALGNKLTAAEKIIRPLETPFAKVVIAGDENGNGKVDWQDGAIAYRETVMHIPAGGESVADAVNLRISMNFGSMAANPFLIALDNVKRVAAHTDGLGQFVLLKGYAGEGHDSNHPQYDNIGIRMGGPQDMLTLMKEGEKLGAVFGIHTNASEFYAEAISDGNQVRRNTDGSIHYGWNWLDQGIAINGVYDYAKGLQIARWNKLYQIVQGHPFVVYVDVWGNNTSGTEDDFMTRALSQNIIGNNHNGWRIAHEWAWANPYESTFQHWVTDYTYGNYSDKGKLNSNVLRFILNQYKDSFPPDFATYGGAANAPLLGGPAMQGFEGWQGDGEYNLSIYNTFNQMIYTKFLQHYPVVEWTNADQAVAMPYGQDHHSARSNTVDWVPETQLKLADEYDEIVVTRGTTGKPMTDAMLAKMSTVDGFLANETEYRSRVVTLNNKVIVTGAPTSAGEDDAVFPRSKSTLKYLIPWYWNAKGERLTNVNDQKLYHWNAQGGISTWELPNGWENVENVTVYALSDQGRGQGKNVKVIEGKITLTAEAETCYVVTPSGGNGNEPQIEYGTGLYLKDPSFNLDTARDDCPWEIPADAKGSAIHTTNPDGIGILKMVGEVSVSQQFTGLKAGTKYVTYAAIDNRSDAKVTMTITDDTGKVVATNYTQQSIARNYVSSYYLHNGHGVEAGGSYFQNMFLYFTPEADRTYTLTISREAGRGNAYVDDVRTVEYGFNYSGFGSGQTAQSKNDPQLELPVEYVTDASGNATGAISSLHQDFENVSQGIWPFVVGPVEGVADNRTHVSELNTPFSQAGWDVKKLDDVIDGNWSIKVNGLAGRQNLVYQTIPQNFRFEPNSVYTVEFDYELGSAGSYVAVVGDGAYTGLDGLTVINLDRTLNMETTKEQYEAVQTTAKATVGHAKFTVVGSTSGQTWIGIYSKDNANNQGTSGSAAAFGGYLDFVLDNLSIELADANKNELALKLQEADLMVQEIYTEKESGAWDAFVAARTAGHDAFDDNSVTDVSGALTALTKAMEKLEKAEVSISGTVKNANGGPVEGVELTLENATYFPVGLTVTTGEDGTYTFVSKSGVELLPGTYHIKAQATGYNVTTLQNIEVLKTAATVTDKDITLVAEAPGAYVNDFNQCLDDGTENIAYGSMGNLLNEDELEEMGEKTKEEVDALTDSEKAAYLSTTELPTMQWMEYNGSGALKVTWHSSGDNKAFGDTRYVNNVVDKTVSFVNGSASFDVTALTTGQRFNVAMRSSETKKRVAVGQQQNPKEWMGEFWNTDGSGCSSTMTTNVLAVEPGVTRNIRIDANGNDFVVYVDGIEAYRVTIGDSTFYYVYSYTGQPGTPVTDPGYIGINMRDNPGSEFIIDNIRIIRADAAEGVQNVSGTVTARSGVAVSGAAVELFDGDTRVAGTTTNALGEYQISRVNPGRYTMKVSAPFFQGKEETVTVVNGADLTGKNFTLTPDISSLTALIAEVEALVEEDYTAETWANLQTALTAAKAINAENATIAALNANYKALSNAKAALELAPVEEVTDFSELRATYNELATKLNDNYTNATWTAFQEALAAAKATLLNGDATQEQVDKAKEDLIAAAGALTPATAPDELDLTALQAAYDAAKDVEKGNASDAAWERFTAARDAALAILSNADGLNQKDVDDAATALKSAQSGLSGGGSGGGGGSAPAETTKTETRDDGAKVTTVTKPDGTVTETVEQPDGAKTETVTAKDGSVTITATDPEGEELAKVEIPATIPEPEVKFDDIDKTPWAVESINNVAGLALVKGTGGSKYDPIAPMTRGSLATVLHRLSQGKTDYENTFKDVAQGKYYTEGVTWAAKAKVVTGYSADIFAPDDVITREQLAVMLARYAKLIGMNTKADPKAVENFADGDSTGTWAVDGVAWCVENGILKGKGQNNLDPTAKVTRAEVAVMLDRFIGLIQK